jgi:hypothetical protein
LDQAVGIKNGWIGWCRGASGRSIGFACPFAARHQSGPHREIQNHLLELNFLDGTDEIVQSEAINIDRFGE